MIGEPIASQLDAMLEGTAQTPWSSGFPQGLHGMPGSLSMPDRGHPMWGGASIDQIVNVQMGVLGIF
jgi:hypothetical protein